MKDPKKIQLIGDNGLNAFSQNHNIVFIGSNYDVNDIVEQFKHHDPEKGKTVFFQLLDKINDFELEELVKGALERQPIRERNGNPLTFLELWENARIGAPTIYKK